MNGERAVYSLSVVTKKYSKTAFMESLVKPETKQFKN